MNKPRNDPELARAASALATARGQIAARQALVESGAVAAGIAYQVQTPLSFVDNFTNVSRELFAELTATLQEKGKGLDLETLEEIHEIVSDIEGNMERVAEHSRRANDTVARMLALGRSDGSFRPTELNELVSRYAALAHDSARALDASFAARLWEDYDEAVSRVAIDASGIARVVLNLVGNACDAVRERLRLADGERRGRAAGGGEYEPTLWLSTRRDDDGVTIRIRDNGSGISDRAIGKVFEPFFSTKPPEQGAGLGLSRAAEIVRRHRGSIRAESEPGRGTTMTVLLPCF